MAHHVEELCKLFALPEKRLETSFTFAWATGLEAPATKNPTPRVTGEWGWKDAWLSETGLDIPTVWQEQTQCWVWWTAAQAVNLHALAHDAKAWA